MSRLTGTATKVLFADDRQRSEKRFRVSPSCGLLFCLLFAAIVSCGKPAPKPTSIEAEKANKPYPQPTVFRLGSDRFWFDATATALVFTSDGKTIVTAHADGTIRIWDPSTGLATTFIKEDGHEPFAHLSASTSPGSDVLAASCDGLTKVWSMTTRECLLTLEHQAEFSSASVQPDGKAIASVDDQHHAAIWDLRTKQKILQLGEEADTFRCAQYSPDGNYLATSAEDGAEGSSLGIWDSKTGKRLRSFGPEATFTLLVYSPDSRFLATLAGGALVPIWDANSGKSVVELLTNDFQINLRSFGPEAVAFSTDGTRLATGPGGATARIWEWEKKKQIGDLLSSHGVKAVAFSSDGKKVVTAGVDHYLHFFDALSGKEVSTEEGHRNAIRDLSFSHDGRFLASASSSGETIVWDLNARKQSIRMEAVEGAPPWYYPVSVRFSADDRSLVLAGGEFPDWLIAEVRDVATGRTLSKINDDDDRPSRFGSLTSSVIDFAGRRFVRSTDEELSLYDVETGKLIGRMESAAVSAFSPGGSLLATTKAGLLDITNLSDNNLEKLAHTEISFFGRAMAFTNDGDALVVAVGGPKGDPLWEFHIQVLSIPALKELQLINTDSSDIATICCSPDGRWIAAGGDDGIVRIFSRKDGLELKRFSNVGAVRCVLFSPDGKWLVSAGEDCFVHVRDVRAELGR